jgi:hypothetical protein
MNWTSRHNDGAVPAYVTEDGEYAILAEGEPSGSWTLYRRVIVVGTRREAAEIAAEPSWLEEYRAS